MKWSLYLLILVFGCALYGDIVIKPENSSATLKEELNRKESKDLWIRKISGKFLERTLRTSYNFLLCEPLPANPEAFNL